MGKYWPFICDWKLFLLDWSCNMRCWAQVFFMGWYYLLVTTDIAILTSFNQLYSCICYCIIMPLIMFQVQHCDIGSLNLIPACCIRQHRVSRYTRIVQCMMGWIWVDNAYRWHDVGWNELVHHWLSPYASLYQFPQHLPNCKWLLPVLAG